MVDDFEDTLRAKDGVPKTLVKQTLRLHSLYFPQNTLLLTECRGEFSDLHSIFRLLALDYWSKHFTTIHMIGSVPSKVRHNIYHLIKCCCLVTITHSILSVTAMLMSSLKMSFGGLWASSGCGRSRVLLVVQNLLFPSFHRRIRFYKSIYSHQI